MRALYFENVETPLKLIDMDEPKPSEGQLLLKVARCGICGSDASLTKTPGYYPECSVLGHEFSGEVVEIGKGVEGFRTGDRVTAMPAYGCGKCAHCLAGEALFCVHGATGASGGFADYMTVGARTATHLPQTLSFADAALTEPLAVGLHGVAMAKIEPGQPILVLGAGSISVAAIFWARRFGAGKIAVLSRSRRKEAMAMKMGADVFVQGGENEVAEVMEALGGPPEIVFEGIGVEGALQQCVNHVAINGKVISLGFCTKPDPVLPSFTTFKQVSMLFSMAYTMREFAYCADHMDKGHVEPGAMITKVIPLEESVAMIEAMQQGKVNEIKIQVDPSL